MSGKDRERGEKYRGVATVIRHATRGNVPRRRGRIVRQSHRGVLGAFCSVYQLVAPQQTRIPLLASSRARPFRPLDESDLRIGRGVTKMGSILGKLCSGQANPLLSLNETCQRLRCLMACCGGNVNVITRSNADVTDASVQTNDDETYKKTTQREEETEGDGCRSQTTV